MSLILTINYDNSDNFDISDETAVNFAGSYVELTTENDPGSEFTQDFSSSSGFTYDPSLSTFSAGRVEQVDKRPANAAFYAALTSFIDANWANGSLTGTPVGGAAISGGYLDLSGGGKYVTYSAVLNADWTQIGTIRLVRQPQYSGSPTVNRSFFSIITAVGSNQNRIELSHLTTGQIHLEIRSLGGAAIVSADLGAWSPTALTDYEFELNVDITAGATRLFVNGVQFGATQTGTGARNAPLILQIGTGYALAQTENAKIKDFAVFNAVQHTANYTPFQDIPDTIYLTDVITLPLFDYASTGYPESLQAFTDFITVQGDVPHYTLNNLWWNGMDWVASDNSYAQSNTASEISSNIYLFVPADTVTVKIITPNSNTQAYIDNLIIEYIGRRYNISNPSLTVKSYTKMDGIDGFAEIATKTSGVELKYILVQNGIQKWWNGASWVTSDGTYAQSNTAAEIEANKATAITFGLALKLKVFLHSDGQNNLQLESNEILYDFFFTSQEPDECLVYGRVIDHDGIAVEGAKVSIKRTDPIEHGQSIILMNASTLTDSEGKFEITAVETETINQYVFIQIEYTNGDETKIITYENVIIPNLPEIELTDLILGKSDTSKFYRSIDNPNYREGWFLSAEIE